MTYKIVPSVVSSFIFEVSSSSSSLSASRSLSASSSRGSFFTDFGLLPRIFRPLSELVRRPRRPRFALAPDGVNAVAGVVVDPVVVAADENDDEVVAAAAS